jgi:hypothetical protein
MTAERADKDPYRSSALVLMTVFPLLPTVTIGKVSLGFSEQAARRPGHWLEPNGQATMHPMTELTLHQLSTMHA